MKKLFNVMKIRSAKNGVNSNLNHSRWKTQTFFYAAILFTAFLFNACKKYNVTESSNEEQVTRNAPANTNGELRTFFGDLDPQTISELQQVRVATAKYHDIENATQDNYVDAGVKIQNMGYHFMKREFISPVFDLSKPAFLVYNKRDDGGYELLAVEYAVPLDPQDPDPQSHPPAGFTGNNDEWDFRTLGLELWTLHAWVWKKNPDGVFKMMNPDVIVQ